MILFIIAGAAILFFLFHSGLFDGRGQEGPVKAEITEIRREGDISYHAAGSASGWDVNRELYRIYVRYEFDGHMYIARSDRKYSNLKLIPGDYVMVRPFKKNKEIVFVEIKS